METIRKIHLEMLEINNIVTEAKDDFEGLICKQNTTKERISENVDSSVDIIQIENQREN